MVKKEEEKIDMNKRYTKKQITEAIAYWKKQLKIGNYRKINESYLSWSAVTLGDPDDPWDVIKAGGGFGNEYLKIRNRRTGNEKIIPAEDADPYSDRPTTNSDIEDAIDNNISERSKGWFDIEVVDDSVRLEFDDNMKLDGIDVSDKQRFVDKITRIISDALDIDEHPTLDEYDEFGRLFLEYKRTKPK